MSEREPPEYCNKRMRPGSGRGAGNSCNPCRDAGGSLRSPPDNLRGMAVPAMTDLDLFLTGSSRAGRPCHCLFLAWLISPLGRNVTVL